MSVSTVLALHGFTGRGASWRFLEPTLPPGVRLLAPDVLGHGEAVAAAGESFDDELDRLAALIAPAPPGSIVVAGYSLGARLALGLLVRRRDRFAGGLLAGVHPGLDDPAERRARVEADEGWARLLESEGIAAFVARWEALPLFASQPSAVVEAQRASRLDQDPRGLARSLRVLGLGAMPSWWSSLPGLDLPVELVVGERDGKFRALAESASRAFPSARLTVVRGAGHNVVLEAPGAVARRLGGLLTDAEGQPAKGRKGTARRAPTRRAPRR